jgi:hypothetical protein
VLVGWAHLLDVACLRPTEKVRGSARIPGAGRRRFPDGRTSGTPRKAVAHPPGGGPARFASRKINRAHDGLVDRPGGRPLPREGRRPAATPDPRKLGQRRDRFLVRASGLTAAWRWERRFDHARADSIGGGSKGDLQTADAKSGQQDGIVLATTMRCRTGPVGLPVGSGAGPENEDSARQPMPASPQKGSLGNFTLDICVVGT